MLCFVMKPIRKEKEQLFLLIANNLLMLKLYENYNLTLRKLEIPLVFIVCLLDTSL